MYALVYHRGAQPRQMVSVPAGRLIAVEKPPKEATMIIACRRVGGVAGTIGSDE